MPLLPHIFEFLKHHWLLVAFLAPMFWAIVNVVDVYFVGEVYRDEFDGTIISGLFQILPFTLLAIFFLKINLHQFINFGGKNNIIWIDPILLLALLGGFLFTASFYFYFKALFSRNDVALLQIIWGLTIVAVPLLAYLFWGEHLSLIRYFGMGITLLGATALSANKRIRRSFSSRYLWVMLGAVLLLSLSMVFEDKVYANLAYRGLGDQGFLLGFLCFALGAFLAGLLFAFGSGRNPFPLIKKYAHIFIFSEGIYFLGNLASQRAIDLAPSVSFVATVETFVPVFIMFFSLIIIFIFFYILKRKTSAIKRIYQEQLEGIWIKIIATVIMAIGVYIIS